MITSLKSSNSSKKVLQICSVIISFVIPLQALFANQYSAPLAGNAIIGNVSYITTGSNETLVSIGQRNNVGVNGMLNANPGLPANSPLPPGMTLKVPSQFILPPLPHLGIVINLTEMRMYYYPKDSDMIMTFPVGIGRVGKTVPTGNTGIANKTVNPTWTPPEDIREFNRLQGIELPHAMGPGPDNPLGPYAIYLKVPTYLIHSTIFPESIGTRASFGCIRMNESDIKQFFPIVTPGTPVAIVDMPNKVGWQSNILYLESHPPLEERGDGGLNGIVSTVEQSMHNSVTLVNWQAMTYVVNRTSITLR